MRLPLVIVAAIGASAPAASAGPVAAPAPVLEKPRAIASDACRRPTSYQAHRGSIHHGERLAPKKLTDLPPATSYMAVYRVINGCEVPMTVTEYRTFGQRR
jgi:hypothetical protein